MYLLFGIDCESVMYIEGIKQDTYPCIKSFMTLKSNIVLYVLSLLLIKKQGLPKTSVSVHISAIS